MPQPLATLTAAATLMLCIIPTNLFAYAEWVNLRALDLPSPRCEGMADLNASADYFVEIANSIPGKDEYNSLIRFYSGRNWSQFEEELIVFKKAFETSPLREAAQFLETEAAIMQVERGDEKLTKAAERKVKEVMLLYPKSKFLPVILLSTAVMAMKNQNYAKALALFETGRNDYPFDKLNCHFQLGVAESHFLLHDHEVARRGFQAAIQKCQDPLSRLIGEIRIADIEMINNKKRSAETYARYTEKFPVRVAKFTPWAYFNAGELAYERKEYPSAGYFFTEFIKYGKKTECITWAMKRVADIFVRRKFPKEKGIGAYLAVFDKFPNSDIGLYSKLHGLLIELPGLPVSETERRLKVFDLEIDKISDGDLRAALFFEKGLALLDLKQNNSLTYLLQFDKREEKFLKDEEVSNYVRSIIYQMIEEQVTRSPASSVSDSSADLKSFGTLEGAYLTWFKGNKEEKKAKELYQKLVISRMKVLLENDNFPDAIARVRSWQNSGVWSKSGPTREARMKITSALLRHLLLANETQQVEFADTMLKNEDVLKPILTGEFESSWLTVWQAKADRSKIESILTGRSPAEDVSSGYSKELKAQLLLVRGRAARFVGKYTLADSYLKRIEYPGLETEANAERFYVAKSLERPELMLEIVTKLQSHSSMVEYLAKLQSVADVIESKRSWTLVDKLNKLAMATNEQRKKLVPFILLDGRSKFEKGNFQKAIDAYETALTVSPELAQSPDLKFRLGKSYLKTKQKDRAKKQWEELLALKDETWSPLAENELHLLQGK